MKSKERAQEEVNYEFKLKQLIGHLGIFLAFEDVSFARKDNQWFITHPVGSAREIDKLVSSLGSVIEEVVEVTNNTKV